MRKLKTEDVFSFCRCLKAIGVKDQFKEIAQNYDSATGSVWDMGFDIIWAVFDLATEKHGERHLYEFFAGPFETTPDGVADMEISELLTKCKQLAQENDLVGFFDVAGRQTKQI